MAGPTSILSPAGFSQSAGTDGHASGGAKRGRRPLPHIDDITSVEDELIDPHAPIDTVLTKAETFLRQAEASKDFGRPDSALKDYIRANVLLLDKIKKNKGWVSLQTDSRKNYERYQRLLRQAHNDHGEFEAIKAEIKADNARTGVRPVQSRPVLDGDIANGHGPARAVRSPSLQVSPRTKPMVQPKPQKLHGNPIHPTGSESPSLAKARELTERFANLRSSTIKTTQDPRVRTQSITSPTHLTRTQTPPQSPFSNGSMADSIADLPKMPDAIYNPPRGTISQEAAELPSSTPRSMFSRTGSTSAISVNKGAKSSPVVEVFATAQSFGAAPPPADEETISVAQLISYGHSGTSVLFVDIRGREEFDNGHVKSRDVICIEPEVLAREHISADQILESMVLAPGEEVRRFEIRGEYDLVVFYDQNSTRINPSPSPYNSEDRAILGFSRALKQYDYSDSRCKSSPKLLRGGLDDWTREFGPTALEKSVGAKAVRQQMAPMASSLTTRRRTFATRPVENAEEAERWEKDFARFAPAKTYDDFLRRFPPITGHQESMTGWNDEASQRPFHSHLSHEADLHDSFPSPPARPAPAVPRTSYSGLAESGDSLMLSARPAAVGSKPERRTYRVGFHNPGNWCFANSALQAMFATPGFSYDIYSGNWKSYRVPRKPNETIDNPQLLMKCLESLFFYINSGNIEYIRAKTFMEYIKFMHKRTGQNHNDLFGGLNQHDSQEFFSFITEIIHDETNTLRDRPQPVFPEDGYPAGQTVKSAMDYWRLHSTANNSIIDKYFRGLELRRFRCKSCNHTTEMFQPMDLWILTVTPTHTRRDTTLYDLLDKYAAAGEVEARCSRCSKDRNVKRSISHLWARFPDRLTFSINRFLHYNEHGQNPKVKGRVVFPIKSLDLSAYAPDDSRDRDIPDRHYRRPFIYDCYAVVKHHGHTLRGGHYTAYVKDDEEKDGTKWWKLDDSVAEKMKVTGAPGDTGTNTLYQHVDDNSDAYLIFYQRRETVA